MSWFLIEIDRDDWILIPASQLNAHTCTRCIGPFRSRVSASWYHRYGRHLDLPVPAEKIEALAEQDERIALEHVLASMTTEERREALEFEAFDSMFAEQHLFQTEE